LPLILGRFGGQRKSRILKLAPCGWTDWADTNGRERRAITFKPEDKL
jgi:hypothetical protein